MSVRYVDVLRAKMFERKMAVYLLAAATAFFFNTYLAYLYGSDIPFWDEWDAQGGHLFVPLLSGQYSVADLLSNHNEHRIFFGRVVWLTSYALSGYWDVQLMMILNSLIHGILVAVLIKTLSSKQNDNSFYLIAVSTVVISLLPAGWENILWGMQAVVYALLLFALLANVVLSKARPLTEQWALGTLLAVCSYLCMASGALTLVPYILFSGYMFFLSRDWKYLVSIVIHGLLTGIMVFSIAKIGSSGGHSMEDLIHSFNSLVFLMSWPLPPTILSAFFLSAPFIIFTIATVRSRNSSSTAWGGILWTLWIYLHIALFAYGRGETTGLASRYADIVVQITIANVGFLVALLYRMRPARYLSVPVLGSIVWGIVVAILLVNQVKPSVAGLYSRWNASQYQQKNLERFLSSGDPQTLAGHPRTAIPYPSEERLISLLRNPALQPVLPPSANLLNVRSGDKVPTVSTFHVGIYHLKNFLLVASPFLAAICGIWLLTTAGMAMSKRWRSS